MCFKHEIKGNEKENFPFPKKWPTNQEKEKTKNKPVTKVIDMAGQGGQRE
ncbi:hypothetical protein I8752_20835 [Nostocaceae cyanobacterium CENA369]|uniref:Uncharacterized protein n=1 Tax=Dendronalium phyllosphericum CENA369 TaxID=1725256 RepID=A0A8J7I5U8_9NOST|nr:hypothetical protein [Dendronalium phyllosphericum CENA369]